MQLIRQLLGLFHMIAKLLADRQLLNAGKADQSAQESKEVLQNVETANRAISTDDPVRTERLRNRFDRSRRQ